MEVSFASIVSNGIGLILIFSVVVFYIKQRKKKSLLTLEKIKIAKKLGLNEPISLHPVVDVNTCIGSGACIAACPEKDILGLVDGQVRVINASRCVGHGACFNACPTKAISLCIGTEKRGVDLPHISKEFETNIPGMYIAGELGGMGLIKNAVEQGRQSVLYFKKHMKNSNAEYDLIIIGAGPAGVSASLTATKNKLNFLTIEQDTLGGTVYNFPRSKVIMTSPMKLPFYGKINLKETSKPELLNLWAKIIKEQSIPIHENEKVESIEKLDSYFKIKSTSGEYTSKGVILAIGRRGSPRKLGIPGEGKEKVAYRLLEPELIIGKQIMVVGGGDSAIESALLLAENNNVNISYRHDTFSRLKPQNYENINLAIKNEKVNVYFNSNLKEILGDKVVLEIDGVENYLTLDNDLVFIFAGGVLPTEFLRKTGITITKKFGEALLKH